MSEGFDAVDEDDGNIEAVAADERGVEVYINFSQRELVSAIGGKDSLFRFVAEVAVRSCVERDLRFVCCVHFVGCVHVPHSFAFRAARCGGKFSKKIHLATMA